jgi:hypothetical protein
MVFKIYLEEKFTKEGKLEIDKLEPIWNINPEQIIMNYFHSNILYSSNGYHTALILHFNQFIDKNMTELNQREFEALEKMYGEYEELEQKQLKN